MPSLRTLALVVALLVYPLSGLYSRLVVLGFLRSTPPARLSSTSTPGILESFVLPDVKQAEDFAYHEPSGLIVLTAPGHPSGRYGWWPPILHLDRPEDAQTTNGGIYILDPTTWKSRRLSISGFTGPFIPHGLDIYSPKGLPDGFYLHAVNHKPASHGPHKANSTVEIFRISISDSSATHLQTVHHPLIVTPNDIYSLSATEFLVTNDHVNREPGLLRTAEEVFTLQLTSRTTVVKVDASSGIKAEVVKKGIHSANGLAHGPGGEIALGSAAGGVLHILSPDLTTTSTVSFPSTLDNPTYLADPYATPSSDLSGYVLAGLLQAHKLGEHSADPESLAPGAIWLARKTAAGKWEKKLLLEDDGAWVNAATTAMLLPIDPKGTNGRREAWVVAVGFMARGISVARVDLTEWATRT